MQSSLLFHNDLGPDSEAFVLLDWPSPGISAALLGPFCPAFFDGKLHHFVCLAADASGRNMAAKRLQKRADNLHSIWPYLEDRLTQGPGIHPAPSEARPCWLADEDAFSMYSDVEFWLRLRQESDPIHPVVRHAARQLSVQACGTAHPIDPELGMAFEQLAKDQLTHKLQAQIGCWLACVSPDLRDTLLQRPRLSVQAVTTLLRTAQSHGTHARQFAIQALRTEPLGLLALMADERQEDGQVLLSALMAGTSIPAQLKTLGVSDKSRRWLLRHERMPLSGRAWLAMARKLEACGIESAEHVHDFWAAIKKLSAMGVQHHTTMANALVWCCEQGGKSLRRRLKLLTQRVLEFKAVLANRPEAALEIDALVRCLLPMQDDSEKDVNCLDDRRFANCPKVPPEFVPPSGWQLSVLNSWVKILDHGVVQGNCLSEVQYALYYLRKGAVLFGLTLNEKTRATIAIEPYIVNGQIELNVSDMDCNNHALLSDAYWHEALGQLEAVCSAQKRSGENASDLAQRIQSLCQSLQTKRSTSLPNVAEALVTACRQPGQIQSWRNWFEACSPH